MKGILLRERTASGAAPPRTDRKPARETAKTAARETVWTETPAAYWLGGLLLSALSLGGRPLPLAACLLYGASRSCAVGALAGAAAGFVLFFGPAAALEPVVLCLCVRIACRMMRQVRCSAPLVLGSVTAVVTLIFAAQAGFRPLDLVHAALSTASAAGILPLVRVFSGRSRPADRAEAPKPDLRGLHKAQGTLELMYDTLAARRPPARPDRLAELYDFTARQVCHSCQSFSVCWEREAEQTYRDLCAAGTAALWRGASLREDYSPRFQSRCSHMEGFLTAANQALDRSAAAGREARRREEERQVAAGQYQLLAGLLGSVGRPAPPGPLRFRPELAVGSACRSGSQISGDRGAACKDRFGNFYVLLCDGMGTGPEAREESDRAAHMLLGLLEAGAEADSAMTLLNGFFALSGLSACSTMDLLRLDLHTGAGTLYKWGAAPSYLRRGEEVKKIGTATPPPGLDAKGGAPGQYALSLKEGETLVMVSDGAFSEQTEQRLQTLTGGSVRDLAACLIATEEQAAADDRTAAVIRLCPADLKTA